jgi:peptide deformylase
MSRKLKFIDGQMLEYELLQLVDKYDPILKKPTEEVNFDTMPGSKIAFYSLSLMETMSAHRGLGLSANQVGLPYRMCAVNMGQRIWSLINPVITDRSKETIKFKEGCLSFPGLVLVVPRHNWVDIEFQAANGEKMKHRFEGVQSVCVQHELDHLDGICFTERVSPVILNRQKSKVKKNRKKMESFA